MKITEWIPVLNVCDWIIYSKLKLNADERYYCLVLLFEQNNNEKMMQHCSAKLFFYEITQTDIESFLMAVQETYISDLSLNTSDCYYHIQDIHRLRLISDIWSIAKHTETAPVASKLDYCNDLLYNVTSKKINKLQGVQNYCLARLVRRSPRFCYISPVKIFTLACNVLNNEI